MAEPRPYSHSPSDAFENSHSDVLLRFIEVLWTPGDVREVRVPKHNRFNHTASGYFDSPQTLAAAAAEWDGKANVYVSLNAVGSVLLARAHNRIVEKAEHTTSDHDVPKRDWLFIDIDPVRPAGVSSSEPERNAARAVLESCAGFLYEAGWPQPVTAMSGNGYYALYRVDLPNDEESLTLVNELLSFLAGRFDTAGAHIDTSVGNAARIVGLVGTRKMKGDPLPERPHRYSELLEVPDQLEVLTRSQMESVLPPAERRSSEKSTSTQDASTERLVDLLDAAGIEYRPQPPDQNGVTWYHIRRCPFHEDGRDFECGVGQKLPDGPFAGHGFHPECSDKGWRVWKEALGLSQSRQNARTTGQAVIQVNNRSLHEVAEDAWSALRRANSPVRFFRHAGAFAEIRLSDEGRPEIVHLDLPALRGRLDRCAAWIRVTSQGSQVVAPARPLVEDMLALEKPLPSILGVVGSPSFTCDGTLATSSGYQPETKLYYWPSGEAVPPVPSTPDETDLLRAKQLIGMEWLSDFPFVDDASRANAISVPITVLARNLIDGPVPLFAFDAPSAGTGKGLLASTSTLVVSGSKPAMMTETRDDEELRKRVTSLLMSGPDVVVLDNVRRRLESGTLASLLTSTAWKDRVLGRSQTIELPNRTVWIVTGNNLQMSDEVMRRTVWIRLDSRRDRPWDRAGFRHSELESWVLRHRADLLWAFLVLVQNWVAKGKPSWTGQALGSFEAWSKVVGGVLESAGISGFLGNRQELYERLDSDGEEWRAFTRAWHEEHRTEPVKSADLLPSGLGAEHLRPGQE